MNVGNFFEYAATGGHPHEVSGWVSVVVWPVLILVAIFARPNNG